VDLIVPAPLQHESHQLRLPGLTIHRSDLTLCKVLPDAGVKTITGGLPILQDISVVSHLGAIWEKKTPVV
jgi:hypothetical protein